MATQVRTCPKCAQLMWLKEDQYEQLDEETIRGKVSSMRINGSLQARIARRQRCRPKDGPLTASRSSESELEFELRIITQH